MPGDEWGVWEWRGQPHEVDLRLVTALLQCLPRNGLWTAGIRRRWLAALTAAIDYTMDVAP